MAPVRQRAGVEPQRQTPTCIHFARRAAALSKAERMNSESDTWRACAATINR